MYAKLSGVYIPMVNTALEGKFMYSGINVGHSRAIFEMRNDYAGEWVVPVCIRRKILDPEYLKLSFNDGFVIRINGIEYREVTPELMNILERIMVLQGIYDIIPKIPEL